MGDSCSPDYEHPYNPPSCNLAKHQTLKAERDRYKAALEKIANEEIVSREQFVMMGPMAFSRVARFAKDTLKDES